MKPPPFLLGATLLFWGWQANFPMVGLAMALLLESVRFTKARWEFSEQDFRRVWTLCTVLFLAAFAYAFTLTRGGGGLLSLFETGGAAQRSMGNTTARTAATFLRWLPMIFFPLMAAQAYNLRADVPASAISFFVRRRLRKAGTKPQPIPYVNVSYPYLMVCLVAASTQSHEQSRYYFWGLCVLLAWALWPQRSRWFGLASWAGVMGLAVLLGYGGHVGIRHFQRWLATYNPDLFSASTSSEIDPLRSRTRLGSIGRVKMSNRIVIRIQPRNGSLPPLYLRSASYRIFNSRIWSANNRRENFESLAPESEGTWPLVPERANLATNNIACYLSDAREGFHSGVLPLPSGSGRLEKLPAYVLQKNSTGVVRIQGPGLVIFDACHGPGKTLDAPPDTNDLTSIPPEEVSALNAVIAEMNLTNQAPDEILRSVRSFFWANFTYRTYEKQLRISPKKVTPLSIFLLKSRAGHCEYFATATVLLLRQLGIPARYATGFAVQEASGNGYVARGRDAHSWCLVWRNGTWQDFDTTPSSWAREEARKASIFQPLLDSWQRMTFEVSKFWWGHAHLQEYLLLTSLPVLLFLVYQIIFRRRWRIQRKQNPPPTRETWPGLDSEFYELEDRLTRRGHIRRPNEPLTAWLERAVQEPALADLQDRLRSLLRLHYRLRFDPQGLALADREQLRQGVQSCLAWLARPRDPAPLTAAGK